MLGNLTIFAGPICLNPTTEREGFLWMLFLGGFLLVVFSIIFGLTAIVVKFRHTFNPDRKLWAKRYGMSLLAFLLLIGLGWLVSTGGTGSDYCHTAETSIQGGAIMFLVRLTLLSVIICLLGFVFSFTKKSKKRK